MFGPTNREVGNPSWMSGAFELGQITITYNRLWILCFTLAVFAILLAMLRYTSLGLEMRAVTQNRRMAASMGIATSRVDALTFGLGSGIAGIGRRGAVRRSTMSAPISARAISSNSFMVVVFGGVGNLWGHAGRRVHGSASPTSSWSRSPAPCSARSPFWFSSSCSSRSAARLFALKGRAVEA